MQINNFALFSYELLSITITDSLPEDCLVLSEPVPGTYKVLNKIGCLHELASCLSKFQIRMICFSAKRPQTIHPVLKNAFPTLRWIYVKVDFQNFPNLTPNHARFVQQKQFDLIVYGQSFSSCEVKEELILAIDSALGLQKSSTLIFQKDEKERVSLNKIGFNKVFASIPSCSQFSAKLNEKYEENKNEGISQLVSKGQNLLDTIMTFWGYNHFQDKKTLTIGITGNKPMRFAGSRSICSLIFLFQGNKKPYLIKSDMPEEIGGRLYQQQQQNKVLASVIYQAMLSTRRNPDSQNYFCLPMQLMHAIIRNSLIKAYDGKKAIFLARPYVKGIQSICKMAHSIEELQILARKGTFRNRPVKGVGKAVALCLMMGENLNKKSIFETLALYHGQNQASFYQCCKIDFSSDNFNLITKEDLSLTLGLSPRLTIPIEDLADSYLKQIQRTLSDTLNCFSLIQGAILHPSWSCSKQRQFNKVKENLIKLCKMYRIIDQSVSSSDFSPKITDLNSINPVYINYLIARDNDFKHFTQKPKNRLYYGGESIEAENEFIQKMKQNMNFVVYGCLTPVYTLMKWIRTYRPECEVEYISLIQKKPDYFISRTKVAKNEGKKKIFVIDHCELETKYLEEGSTIADVNRGFKTIFVYRLEPTNCKRLQTVSSNLNFKANMIDTEEELLKSLIYLYDKQFQRGNIFKCRLSLIMAWLRNKWCTYIQKEGYFTFQDLTAALRKLVGLISQNKNRLGYILERETLSEINATSSDSSITIPTSTPSSVQAQIRQSMRSQLILYCLPIYIEQQRVYLIHDIYQFLQAQYLLEDLISLEWAGQLKADQLDHFVTWFQQLSERLKKEMTDRIIMCLDRLFLQSMSEGSALEKCNDCLELLRKIGVTRIFSKHEWIQYYPEQLHGIYPIPKQNSLMLLQKDYIMIELSQLDGKKPTRKQYQFQLPTIEKQLEVIACQKQAEVQQEQFQIFRILKYELENLDELKMSLNFKQELHFLHNDPERYRMKQKTSRFLFPTELDQNFYKGKKIVKIVKISQKMLVFFNNQGSFCFFGIGQIDAEIIQPHTFEVHIVKLHHPGAILEKIETNFVENGQILHCMVGISHSTKTQDGAAHRLLVKQFQLRIKWDGQKDQSFAIKNITTHELPQYSSISCFSLAMNSQGKEKTAWVFIEGSDSLTEWSLKTHGVPGSCTCCPLRRIFKFQPNPLFLTPFSPEYVFVGSGLNFLKKMKLSS